MLYPWGHFKHHFQFFILGSFLLFAGNAVAQPHLKRACTYLNNPDIVLSWDVASDPCAQFVEIEIFARPGSTTPFTSIGKVTNLAQSNFVHLGAATITTTWSYQLVYRYLCNGFESYSDTVYVDIKQPKPSVLDSVSYDPVSGGLFLAWSANNADDLYGYYLWDYENNNGFIFDSVYNKLNYLDQRKDPGSGQIFYLLTAFDSCLQQSLIQPEHAAPFLRGSASNCGSSISLNWEPYVGHATSYTEVYVKRDGGNYTIDTLILGNSSTWNLKLLSGQSVEIFVRSKLANGYTSRSNPVSFTALDSFKVKANYISSIDWIGKNTLELDGIVTQAVNFDSLYIYRITEGSRVYLWRDELSILPYPITTNIKSDTIIHYYQQIMVDRCGRYYYSNIGHNLVLKGNPNGIVDQYDLYWTPPSYLDGAIQEFQLTLGDDISMYSTWNNLKTNLGDTFSTEYISDETLNIRCFQAIAIEEDPNSFNYSATLHSNPVCFIQDPSIYFPNAIAVRGINNTYAPVGLSIDKKKSTIQIFTLNGQRVYSNILENPWNGYAEDGSAFQTTAFLYIADVYFLNGERQKYSGNITVLY